MWKVINGKKYDTSTAVQIAVSWSERSRTDFGYWEESLYRKRTGEFFLYGWGGPLSKYQKWISDNECSGGEKITPLTEEQAKRWGEIHMTSDEYGETFGEVDE